MKESWFILCDDHHLGPFDEKQIRQLYLDGKIDEQIKLWKKGEKSWKGLKDFYSFDNLFVFKSETKTHSNSSSLEILKKTLEETKKKDNVEKKGFSLTFDEKKITDEIRSLKQKQESRFSFATKATVMSSLLVLPLAYGVFLYGDWRDFKEIPGPFRPQVKQISMKDSKSVEAVFYWGNDGNIWLGSNRPGDFEISLSLQSLPGKVLCDEEIFGKGSSFMENHSGKIQNLNLKSNKELCPGHYWISLTGRPVGREFRFRKYLRDLLPEIMAKKIYLPKTFSYNNSTLLVQGSKGVFQKKLARYNQKKQKRIKNGLLDRRQKYHLFHETLLQLKTSYEKTLNKIKRGLSIGPFESKYVSKVNNRLELLILENRKKMNALAQKSPFESNEYRLLADFGDGITVLVSEMVLETKKQKYLTRGMKRHLKKKYGIRMLSLLKQAEIRLDNLQGVLDHLN